MKIRIKGNSVRFRLTRPEVKAVCNHGEFKQQTEFNKSVFKYGVRIKEGGIGLEASFRNSEITMYLPLKHTDEWLHTNRVGFENSITLENGNTLDLLLEKDFVCLDETTADQSDNYPNPLAEKIRWEE